MLFKILFLLGCTALIAYSSPITNLTIKETAGINRTNEDVTMGLPLPENMNISDTSRLSLRDESNNLIPCEIKKISNWYKNPGAIRWLQLNFPYSITANATKTVTLSLDDAPNTLASKLTVVDNGTTITVNTGNVRFIVKKANFNLLDQVWVDETGSQNYTDANQVVASHSRGIIHYLENVEYLSSNDAASTVTIERQGPCVVTLKATGKLKNNSGDATLAFVTRIYTYNNSSSIKIHNTIEFRDPDANATVNIQGAHLEIPMNLGATRTALVGRHGGSVQAVLSGTQDAFCMVRRPSNTGGTDGVVINGSIGGEVTSSTFNPVDNKPKDIGWVALYDGVRGCVAGMKDFWQMVPTSVEAFGNGKIILGSFSKRAGHLGMPLGAGTARSCETRWTFFNTATPETIRSKAAAITDRLFALASPFWYTRRTNSTVHMVEVNQSIYTPADWATVSSWDTKMNNIWDNIFEADDSWIGEDSYGFLEWGDNPHYWTGFAPPCDMLWNGNYYGMDFFAFEQFYHTGDARYLTWGIAHARQVADVHQVHFGETNANTGASRYCPPSNHIWNGEGCTPTFGHMGHHKTEGLFMNFYLTGDDYSLQCALEGANWAASQNYAYAIGPSDNVESQIRMWSNNMNDLIWAYEYNQNINYYNNLWMNWEVFRENIWAPDNPAGNAIGQPFMTGLAMESIVKLYYILAPSYRVNSSLTKPDSIVYFLKKWCDRVSDPYYDGTGSDEYNSNTTIGYAFLSQFGGEDYRTTAARRAGNLPAMPNNLHKDFAQQARNLEMAMYYFAIPDSVNTYTALEKNPTKMLSIGDEFNIAITPTPFKPSTVIRLSGKALQGKLKPIVRIYTLTGALVKDLSAEMDNNSHSAVWNASGQSTNMYVIKCTLGNKVFTKTTALLR